jgi:hypothetical protein
MHIGGKRVHGATGAIDLQVASPFGDSGACSAACSADYPIGIHHAMGRPL